MAVQLLQVRSASLLKRLLQINAQVPFGPAGLL